MEKSQNVGTKSAFTPLRYEWILNLKILKPKKLSKFFFPLFWEEYEELIKEHEFMFFKLWIAPNGKNKQNKYYVEEPHTFSPDSKPKPNSKPLFFSLSLSLSQDLIITFMAMVFRSRLFLSQALFSHKPSALSLSL